MTVVNVNKLQALTQSTLQRLAQRCTRSR